MSSSVSSSGPGKPWEPPTPEALQPELPQYEIISLLGRGGMGAVYKARQKSLKREVAIKVLPPTIDDGGMQFAERFKAEAESMARLNHPGVVAVYDAGETPGGLLYIVMEFVEGTDVSQMIKSSGKLPPDYAYSITAHVCDALAYAHANGLIHRDIKPANIMVDKEGRVKVADFGLAKMTNENSGFTQTNMAVGTPDFVAPEALYPGVPLDGRADLYAVGVMLYQMLTGSVPRGAFKPASVIVPGVDARYDQIVLKAMQVDREERYSSAVELRQHLDTLLIPAETPVPSVPQQPASAALPQAGMTGAQTVVAQRPSGASAQQSRPSPQPTRGPSHSYAPPPPKSKVPLFLGIAAVAAVAMGAFVMLGGKQKEGGADDPPSSASSSGTVKTSSTIAAATKDAPFVNSLGMKFVPVPITGGPTDKQRVIFSMWETRVQDYEVFAKETKHEWPKPDFEQGGTHPAVNVNWADATAFCTWLTERERKVGKLSTSERYRLPSDHEWSCAVGIGEREDASKLPREKDEKIADVFPWGTTWPPSAGNGNYAGQELKLSKDAEKYREITSLIAGFRDGAAETAPVGSFNVNRFGLYDLSGNVWELCEEWYDAIAQKDRVLRGASWMDRDRNYMLSSKRLAWAAAARRSSNLGFRCVLFTEAAPATAATKVPEPAKPATALPAPPLSMPAPGQVIDLLATLTPEVVEKTGNGWRLENGALHNPGKPFSSLPLPGNFAGVSYQVRVKLRQLNAKEVFNLDLPVGDRMVGFALDGFPVDGYYTGLQTVNGKMGKSLPGTTHGKQVKDAELHDLAVTVRPAGSEARITATLDGKPLYEWAGPAAGLIAASIWKSPPGTLTMGTIADDWRVYEVKAEVLDASSPVPAAPSPAITKPESAATHLPPELAALDVHFIALQKERVTAPFEADVAKLNTGYLGGIAKKIAEEKAAGHLDGILALEAEQKLLADKQPVPDADDDKTHVSLKALRSIYRAAYAKLASTRAANLKALIDPLEKRLVQMEADFTKADRVADAKTVRGYREVLAESGKAEDPPSAAGPPQTALGGPSALSSKAAITPAAALALKNGITNSLGMKLVPVKGTDLLFCIHETRRKDYAAYAAEVADVDVGWKSQNIEGIPSGGEDDHPVVGVSWHDAHAFCAWLSKKEGKTYRLPTDEEWSGAIGLSSKEKRPKDITPEVRYSQESNTEYPWGGNFPPKSKDKAGNYSDTVWKASFPAKPFIDGYTDGFITTAPVMSFKPTKLGLYDMGGNVWEWVEDWKNPATQFERTLRGGCFADDMRERVLSSGRHFDVPTSRNQYHGFRIVLEVQ